MRVENEALGVEVDTLHESKERAEELHAQEVVMMKAKMHVLRTQSQSAIEG